MLLSAVRLVFPHEGLPRADTMLPRPLHIALDNLVHLPSEMGTWIISIFLPPAQTSLLSDSLKPGSWVGPWLPSATSLASAWAWAPCTAGGRE